MLLVIIVPKLCRRTTFTFLEYTVKIGDIIKVNNDNNIMIKVENLEKSFGSNHVLKGISTEIKKGEVIVVIGASGSGKSSFLRCLNCLEDPTSGNIFFDGVDIADVKVDINVHRQKMGMVFQHFNLFPHLTVMENITLAPVTLNLKTKEEAEAEAIKLLERVGLAEKANAYPSTLSGGQKQRIAIVRSLAMHPDVMLFDEPTSALDSFNEEEISQALNNLFK